MRQYTTPRTWFKQDGCYNERILDAIEKIRVLKLASTQVLLFKVWINLNTPQVYVYYTYFGHKSFIPLYLTSAAATSKYQAWTHKRLHKKNNVHKLSLVAFSIEFLILFFWDFIASSYLSFYPPPSPHHNPTQMSSKIIRS